MINKTSEPVSCSFPVGIRAAPVARLHAPAIDAKEAVEMSAIKDSCAET